jgi:cytochrome c553
MSPHDILGYMARHAWAVNRLCEALVKGDAALWTRGLNELAVVGLGAKGSAARGAVYGRLVAACSACHEAMGRAPGARVDTAGE